ncbi:Protein of unknown function [Pyronema omphalodes CBS 100304]|uniref:Uncharacterized protein n=1 Tax=Pyronema omphalodes (strain CBS 100304) TaxID=1076935 RepID=U4L1N3_PYROM|nr:Protein of unknown function [Pyronema omphalodes CBS 100304]
MCWQAIRGPIRK